MNSEACHAFRRIWLVGFAGHRKVADPAALKLVIRKELEDFDADLDGEVMGIASAAAGADLLFLEACVELGIRTVVILPFGPERFRQDFDDPEEWERSERLVDAALWSEVAPGNEEAPAAYHIVARRILEVADRMLFAWDGQPARGLGGTGETVAEAEHWEIPARIIATDTLEVRWQGTPLAAGGDPAFQDLPAAGTVAELFTKLDERAVASAPKSRWFAAGSMSVNHMATFLQAVLVLLILSGKEIGAAIKFVLALVAMALPWVGSKLRLQDWVGDRVRAELLRSLLASHEPGSPLHPPAAELFERDRTFLRSAALHLVTERRGWETARDAYLRERVDGQIGFFNAKGEKAKRRMRVFGALFWIASWAALIFTGAAVFMKVFKTPVSESWDRWAMEFIPSVLPGIAAWTLAMISVFEFRRRAQLYGQMEATLRRLRPTLAVAKCSSAAERAIQQIERLLLNELWEWQGPRRKP
jgi:hypothetical protein